LGTHTKAHNRLTNTRVEKLVAIRANLKLFEPDIEPFSSSLESDMEDEASEFDVLSQMFKRWTLRRSREKTWKPETKTTTSLVSRLSIYRMYVENVFGRCDVSLGSFNIAFILLSCNGCIPLFSIST
jgi:hypothetical protein